MKMNKFEIEDYTLTDENIEIILLLDGSISKDLTIKRWDFERWLKDNQKLDYCNDYADARSFCGHGQDTGVLSLEEYWQNGKYISTDLYEYTLKNVW